MLRTELANPITSAASVKVKSQTMFESFADELNKLLECPISNETMQHPVVTPCGHTFDEKNIIKWIMSGTEKDEQGRCCNRCPECNATIVVEGLRVNSVLVPFIDYAKKLSNEFKKLIETEKAVIGLQAKNVLLQEKLSAISRIIQSDVLENKSQSQDDKPVASSSPFALFNTSEKKPNEKPKFLRPKLTFEEQKDQDAKLIHAFSCEQYSDAIKALELGANPDFVNNEGCPLLIELTIKSDLKAVKLLAEYGANLNAQRSDGNTALHWSTYLYNEEITSVLLKNGADPRVVNKVNRNALEEFVESGRIAPEIVNMLLARISELENISSVELVNRK